MPYKPIIDVPWSTFKQYAGATTKVSTSAILKMAQKVAFGFHVGETNFYIYALDISGNCN